jgi:hypothetical protein
MSEYHGHCDKFKKFVDSGQFMLGDGGQWFARFASHLDQRNQSFISLTYCPFCGAKVGEQ